jgi:hypothetical protein
LKSGSVTVCIFKKAYEKHKIIGEGTVVAILNPSIWKADAKCPAVSCSYDTQILAVGLCPDLGVCKGLTRTGECCGVNINLEHGSVCEFHLQQQLHSIRLKRAELNNRSVAGASSNRLFVPGGGAIAERPTGYNKPGPRVPMQVTYTPKMNVPTPGRVALTSNSTVSLENYEYFAGFAPPPPVTSTWKPTMASSPVIRKIQERISSNASEPTASVLLKSKDSDPASKAVPKPVQSAAKTTQRPATRPPPVHLSSPVAQPVFCSSELEDDCLIVLEDPADALASSVGMKRARAPHETSSNTSKKDSLVSSVKSSDTSTIGLKQPSASQRPEAVVAPAKSAPVAVNTVHGSVAVAKDSKALAPQPRPESGKSMPSQSISSSAAKHHQLQPSAVAALQAKIQQSSKTDMYASKPAAAWFLPGGGAVQAPSKDNSQLLLKAAQNFGVDVEAVKSQHSAHEDIADQSIKEREQRHTDMLFEAAKLQERQMGVMESKVSVWKCSKCSYIGYKYCPLHEDKAFNKRVEAIQRYFSCSHCKARITWLRNTLCTVACKCGNTQWKQCSQFKGKVASSEDVWRKANTPSEFSLYHQQ